MSYRVVLTISILVAAFALVMLLTGCASGRFMHNENWSPLTSQVAGQVR